MSPHLEVSDGEQAGRRLRLDGELLLGTAVTGDGRLADPVVSRRHARVRIRDDGRVVLEDLDSTNGTWVNGQRLGAPRELDPGDVIRIGRTSLRFADPPVSAPVSAGAAPARSAARDTVVGGIRPSVSAEGTVAGGARPSASRPATVAGSDPPGATA
ncbi:MAG: hypothetical protein AVDCRST_MAG65-487, partial [uncultured Solirubrobacteraceae bacterium]